MTIPRVVRILSVIGFSLILMLAYQNCGPVASGTSNATDSSSAVLNLPAPEALPPATTQVFLPMSCENSSSYKNLGTISESDFINSYGRISHDINYKGFLDLTGKALLKFSHGTFDMGAGYNYKWFNFKKHSLMDTQIYTSSNGMSQIYCGITTDDKVRCTENSTAPPQSVEISSLAGSTQVTVIGSSICGLKNGGVECFSPITLQNTILNFPEPIALFGNDAVIAQSYKQYLWVQDAAKPLLNWGYYPHGIMSSNFVNTYVRRVVEFCDLTIKSASFPEFINYSTNNGCVVSDKGYLFCVRSLAKGDEFQMQSLKSDGTYTDSLASLDPDNTYLAVAAYSDYTACALRSDSQVVCFTLGQGSTPAMQPIPLN